MRAALTAGAAALIMAAAACSSGSSTQSAGSPASSSSASQITIGVLTSLTGAASSSFTTVEDGVKARLGAQNAQGGIDGHRLKYVMADDTSSGTGAVSAVQKLTEQDNVYGILDDSSFFAAAAPATKAAGVPVAGSSFDGGPEWHDPSYTNIFDAFGYADYTIAATTYGDYFKSRGCTKVAAVGYAASPSSASAAQLIADSTAQAGLQKGFVDTSLAFGSTNVGPIIQAIKASGADCLYLPVVESTAFATVVGLKQAGVSMKSDLLATGYGQDLLSSKAASSAAQGVDFTSDTAPVELGTPGTKALQSALAQYAGVTTIPTFGEYLGWLTADLFIRGLQLAGPGASKAQFISELRSSTWDGAGLEKATDYADLTPVSAGLGPGNCMFVVKLEGSKFVPISGSAPICGTIIPGIKLNAGS